LSADEIRLATTAVHQDSASNGVRIVSVTVEEPDKALVLRAQPIARQARVVTYNVARDVVRELLVELPAARIVSTRHVPNVQPMLSGADAERTDSILRADPRWTAALAKRGLRDLTRVIAGAWSAGYFGDSTERGRMVRVIPYLRDSPKDREYLRPIEGLVADVNLTRNVMVRLSETADIPVSAARPIDVESGYRAPNATSDNRDDAVQINGQSIAWRQWRLHIAPNLREGVVVHRARYIEGTRERMLLYRASVSEMVVPYGDPQGGWFFRNALDEGELGLGQFVQPLREGVDVPVGAHFLSAINADERGAPVDHAHAIAVYERDGGLAWRHLELARRSRELVIEWIASLGNYEYGFAWILHEDGSIEQRTTLSGIMSVKGTAAVKSDASPAPDAYGQRITTQLIAPHHQHFFAFRLDPDVDGAPHQQVVEVDGQRSPTRGATDPHSAMTAGTTVLRTEHDAQRQTAGSLARRWTVQNTHVRNAIGAAVGMTLMPGENARPLADSAAWIRQRAGFLDAQLWVTPYRANELYAAGEYPNQSRGGDGLPAFTRANASVTDTDVVLWYVMGITHLPRTEDWPVMPAHVAGFRLVPTGFFDANPLMKR
jgi:primary-amine oxidase